MKKGFTLVELLAVIALLALLALIALPVIDSMLDKQKEKIYVQNAETVKDAMKNWSNENTKLLPDESEEKSITLGTLKEEGLIEKNFKNPKTKKCYSNGNTFRIKNTNGVYTYEVDDLIDGNDSECQNIEYTYYSEDGEFTASTTNTVSTHPENSIYLKAVAGSTSLEGIQVCMHDGYNELCFYPNDYDRSRAKLLNYVNYDENTWTTVNNGSILTSKKKSPDGKTTCKLLANSVDCSIQPPIFFIVEVSSNGGVSLTLENKICSVSTLRNPSCGPAKEDGDSFPGGRPNSGSNTSSGETSSGGASSFIRGKEAEEDSPFNQDPGSDSSLPEPIITD